MAAKTLLYEVTLDVEPEIVEDFDVWLRGHVEEMLSLPGFLSASIDTGQDADFEQDQVELERSDEEDGGAEEAPVAQRTVRRIVRYRLRDRASLDRYLEEHAPRMRQDGLDRFGERFSASRRVLDTRPVETRGALIVPSTGYKRCSNCDAELIGKFCASCGQRDRQRLPSVFEMMGEFLGDVFEYDSRLWRSVVPLLLRPGYLTWEYIRGRRVRYLPPVRMYLVVSIVFFLMISLDAGLDGEITVSPEDRGASVEGSDAVSSASPWYDENLHAETPSAQAEGEGIKKARGEIPLDPAALAAVRERMEAEAAAREAEGETAAASGGSEGEASDQDDDIQVDLGDWGFFDATALEQRLESQARKIQEEGGGKVLGKVMLENLPTMLFVFLPVVALVLKLLYPLSGRLYVEHLIFTLHYHSFFFLELIITMSLFRLAEWVPSMEVLAGIVTAAVSIWTPIYLFLAMKRVYDQGYFATFFKYILLNVAYFMSLLITVALTAVISLLSI